MEDTKTIKLRKPLTLGDMNYSEVNLREPTAGELAKATKTGGNVDAAIALISLVGGIPKTAVENMCQRDLAECSDFLGSFSIGQ